MTAQNPVAHTLKMERKGQDESGRIRIEGPIAVLGLVSRAVRENQEVTVKEVSFQRQCENGSGKSEIQRNRGRKHHITKGSTFICEGLGNED